MMTKSTIAIVILIVTVILFAMDKIPLCVTAILAMLAMAFTGVISYEEAFSGFSSNVVFMIIGMSMLSGAFFSVGLSHKIGNFLMRFTYLGEKRFILILFILSVILGAFFNAMIVITIFAPIIDCVAMESGGSIKRKMCYLPMAIGSVIGGHATAISASCIMTASGMLEENFGRSFSIFEPLKIGFPGILIGIFFYMTIGYSMQKKYFDFPESEIEISKSEVKLTDQKMTGKMWFVLFVTVICIICFILGMNMGAIAMLGACIVIVTGCVSVKDAIRNVSWETVFAVAGSIGFAQGVSSSGAAYIITEYVLKITGPLGESAFAMCAILMLLGTVLSNFMSNTATVTLLLPIAFSIASSLGASPTAFALACGIGSDMAIATPICTAAITYTTTAGYRVKDYMRIGGLLNLGIYIVDVLALSIFFF